MSIQSILNKQALEMLPQAYQAIENMGDNYIRNQAVFKSLNLICNSNTPLANMTKEELREFDSDLIEIFQYKGWL